MNYLKEDTIASKLGKIKSIPDDGSKQVTTIECKTIGNADSRLPEQENNLEYVLDELKLSGRYHIRFLFLISFLIVMNSGYTLHYTFSAEDVGYGCNYSDCKNTTKLEQNSTIDYKCHKYELLDISGTCTEDNFNVSNYTDCSEWVYDEPNSFVAEFDLGCKDWKRTLVGTMHSVGFMVGLLIIGPSSDKFGRKKMVIFSSLFSVVVGISKSMVTKYWIFIVLETLEAVFGDNYSTAYTMVAEMMTTKNRPVIVLMFAIADSLGAVLIALLAYLTPNWRYFLISLYSPALIVILYIFYLDESPRWLLTKGRKAEAEKIIKNAAKLNNTVIDESKFDNLKCEETTSLNLREALNITFSSRKLLMRLVLCFCIWFTSLFNTYALLINAVSLEGDKYINFGLVSLSAIAGGVILLYILTKFKRKGPLMLAMTFTGAFCIAQSFVPKGYRWLSTLLYVCGEINTTITMKLVYLYTTELFPTYTRNTMLALCSAVGRVGAILAPLTPLLFVYWSSLPSFLVGVLSLVTALIVTLMPDTSEDVLPDNVQQAEIIGSKEKKKESSNI